eukprot:COSAG04_NODE_13882_length_588_cov_1.366053_1_plen_22_part_10
MASTRALAREVANSSTMERVVD